MARRDIGKQKMHKLSYFENHLKFIKYLVDLLFKQKSLLPSARRTTRPICVCAITAVEIHVMNIITYLPAATLKLNKKMCRKKIEL